MTLKKSIAVLVGHHPASRQTHWHRVIYFQGPLRGHKFDGYENYLKISISTMLMSKQTKRVIYFQGPLRGQKFDGYENHLKISIVLLLVCATAELEVA